MRMQGIGLAVASALMGAFSTAVSGANWAAEKLRVSLATRVDRRDRYATRSRTSVKADQRQAAKRLAVRRERARRKAGARR